MHQNPKTQPQKRLAYLDSIRGLAALLVAYLHFSEPILKHPERSKFFDIDLFFFSTYLDFGKIGVVTFFAISGFVIPFSLMNKNHKPIKRFLISRFFRLYPVYWLSIPLAIYLAWKLEGKIFDLTTIALNITMFQQFFLKENIMGLYWTLQIELIFYILCVFLFYFKILDKIKIRFAITIGFLVLAVAMAYIRYTLEIKLPVALALALMFMFWGTIWRDYSVENNQICKKLGLAVIGIFIPVMPIIALLAYNKDMGYGENWLVYTLSYYSAVAILLLFTTRIRLEHSIFSWLGRISYSVYLFHGIINRLFMIYFDYDLLIEYNIPAHALIIIGILISIGVSHYTYKYVEAPMIYLGRKINKRLFG